MWVYTIAILILGAVTLSSESATAGMSVVDIAFAGDIQDRDPHGRLEPGGSCEAGENGQLAIPVFDSTAAERIFFWNKVQVSTPGVLRHIWYMKKENDWSEAATIDLTLGMSSGYRTWSSKKIVRALHAGEWKVEVSASDDPSQVLCTARFRVE